MKIPILDFFFWLSVYPSSPSKKKAVAFQSSTEVLTSGHSLTGTCPRLARSSRLCMSPPGDMSLSHSSLVSQAPGILSQLTHTPTLSWQSLGMGFHVLQEYTWAYTLPTKSLETTWCALGNSKDKLILFFFLVTSCSLQILVWTRVEPGPQSKSTESYL